MASEAEAATAMQPIQVASAQASATQQKNATTAVAALAMKQDAVLAAAAAATAASKPADATAATPAATTDEQGNAAAALAAAASTIGQEETPAAAATAALTPAARHAQRSMRASTLNNSRATIADQQQRRLQELQARLKLEQQQAARKLKQERRAKKPAPAGAADGSPDEVDSGDSAWSPPVWQPRKPSKVKVEPSMDEEDAQPALPFLPALPPPVESVVAELAAGSLPPPPPLPQLPPAMLAQVLEAYHTTARKLGLLPLSQPMQIDDTTAAITDDEESVDDYPKRKATKKKRKGSVKKKGQSAKKKQRAIQSSTPAIKRARPKKPVGEVAAAAAAAAAAPALPPIPPELVHPPVQQPTFIPAQFLHASTALSMMAASNQLPEPATSSPSLPWQAPLRSISPLPSHDLTPLPFPPLPSAADAAAYLASSPPPEEPGMEEETTLRSASALSCTPLSTTATPLSVPSELADAEAMCPCAVANAMLLSSPGLIPFSYAAEPDGSSPSPLRLAAQAIEASNRPPCYPTESMHAAAAAGVVIPPIDPNKIRFGPLDSEAYRDRVKHNAIIAQRAAAFESEQH